MIVNHPAVVPPSLANNWMLTHLSEIHRRARARLAPLHGERLEEAIAEIVATIFKSCTLAERRGVLDRITPFHAVRFAIRHYRQGRRMAGYSSTDICSESAQAKGRVRLTSLSSPVAQPPLDSEENPETLAETLADRRCRCPSEQARQNLDYPVILAAEDVSEKARKLFHLLSCVRGTGHVNHIARLLGVSPGRVCQLKKQLANVLSRHDYAPIAGAAR